MPHRKTPLWQHVNVTAVVLVEGTCAYLPERCAQGMHIVGVDPNPEMASYALQAAQEANLPRQSLQLLDGTAEQLPVPSTSQDAVVCTLVSDVRPGTQTDIHTCSCCLHS